MGKVEHFEIPADDVSRAKAFYGSVFGWSYEEWDADTAMIHPAGEGTIGGDISAREGRPGPTVVITVDSIEDALAAVVAAGGSAIGEIQSLGDEGRYAYFTDSEGNRLGLWDSPQG